MSAKKSGPAKGSTHAHGKLQVINTARKTSSRVMGQVAFDLVVQCRTLEQIQAELEARGFRKYSLSAISRAWRAYSAERPTPDVEERRRAELERLDERERRMRSYIDLVDGEGRPVQPPLKTALEVETRLATICQQRIHLGGLAAPPTMQLEGELAGSPLKVTVVYPSGVAKPPKDPEPEGSAPASAAAVA
ncbi:MAG TPA: hypothetical protein VGI39_39145 [Polyangiaceae bacterium]|jgi:hypothetical protein